MENQTIERIKLSKIKSMIPNLLYKKFEMLGIEDVKGVLNLNLDEFLKGKGIGEKVASQLVDFNFLICNEPEKLLEKYENNISNSTVIDEESDLGKVSLADIPELIDSRLINKFQLNKIDNLYQLSKITEVEFSKWRSVGKASKELFSELILKLKEEPDIFLTAYRNKTIPKILPIEDSGHSSNNDYLEQFKRIINDYLSLLINKRERERDILIKRYGLFNNDQYNTVEIGLYYEISHERIRQLILEHLKNLKLLLKGETLDDPFCIIDIEVKKNLDMLSNFINSHSVISNENLIKSFQENFNILSTTKNYRYLNILLDALDIEITYSKIPFSHYGFYFINSKIDKNLFHETSKCCYDFLRDTVTPIKEFDLIISLRKQYRNISKEYIQLVLSQIPEIEKINPNEKEKMYQIRFDRLKSGGDQAERVLFEKGRSMSLDEIVSEINHRLFNLGDNKTISRKSMNSVIIRNKNIIPKGRTGYYSLADWDENSETIYDVIYKAFLHHQKPLTYRDIIEYVKTIRPNINDNSIKTITNDRFLSVKDGKYIIPTWEYKYKDLIISKTKKQPIMVTIKEQIRQMLLNEPQKKLEQKEFSKKVREKLKIGFPTFYSSINDGNMFIKSNEGGIKFITAIENPIIIKSDKRNEALKLVHQILEINNGSCLLATIVKEIGKKGISKGSAYKSISSDPNLEKLENEAGIVILSKKKDRNLTLKSNQGWEATKKKIEREIKDIFDDPRQPQYSISFSDVLDMFYKLIVKSTSESGLNGLEERLLPTIEKYFNSNDRNDRLNFLTQIATSIDPFFKKLLLFADQMKYQEFKSKPKRQQGLGTLIDCLDKLDSRLNRYKPEERNTSLVPFGKQMFVAYNNRNIEAHEAEDWAEKDIVKIITSCLVIYVFSIFEYYDELNRRLK